MTSLPPKPGNSGPAHAHRVPPKHHEARKEEEEHARWTPPHQDEAKMEVK